jgi:hypothetical protein
VHSGSDVCKDLECVVRLLCNILQLVKHNTNTLTAINKMSFSSHNNMQQAKQINHKHYYESMYEHASVNKSTMLLICRTSSLVDVRSKSRLNHVHIIMVLSFITYSYILYH